MAYVLSDIASAIGAELKGNGDLVVERLSEPGSAGPDDLALATSPTYAEALGNGSARAAVLWADADWTALDLDAAIFPVRPRFAMAHLTAAMDAGQGFEVGIHPTALIDPSAQVPEDASIGPFSIVQAGAQLGASVVIGPHCYIGAGTVLGDRAYLREHVSIGANARIGHNFIAQPGARIGSDGFSFVTSEKSNAETTRESLGDSGDAQAQTWHRIHSLGGVVIGNDVEIGANSCVDNGTIRPTRIGNGTKLDNLVHVGHNVSVGQNCLLCGQVGIAGSSTIGNNVVLGGQVGLSDNISIGDNVVAGGASKIFTNVPAGRAVLGHPATKMEGQIEIYKSLRRLPRLLRDVASLKKAISKFDGSD